MVGQKKSNFKMSQNCNNRFFHFKKTTTFYRFHSILFQTSLNFSLSRGLISQNNIATPLRLCRASNCHPHLITASAGYNKLLLSAIADANLYCFCCHLSLRTNMNGSRMNGVGYSVSIVGLEFALSKNMKWLPV